MNNFELDDQCKTLAATKTNYELAKDLILLRESLPSIKADAVREWADQAEPNNESQDRMVNGAYDYANKIERGDS